MSSWKDSYREHSSFSHALLWSRHFPQPTVMYKYFLHKSKYLQSTMTLPGPQARIAYRGGDGWRASLSQTIKQLAFGPLSQFEKWHHVGCKKLEDHETFGQNPHHARILIERKITKEPKHQLHSSFLHLFPLHPYPHHPPQPLRHPSLIHDRLLCCCTTSCCCTSSYIRSSNLCFPFFPV